MRNSSIRDPKSIHPYPCESLMYERYHTLNSLFRVLYDATHRCPYKKSPHNTRLYPMPQKQKKGGKRPPYSVEIILHNNMECTISRSFILSTAPQRPDIKPKRVEKYHLPANILEMVGIIRAKYP